MTRLRLKIQFDHIIATDTRYEAICKALFPYKLLVLFDCGDHNSVNLSAGKPIAK